MTGIAYTEPALKRVVVFVDGQNLYYAAKDAFGYNYPNYDVAALANAVCKKQTWNLSQIQFYTGVPDVSDDPFWNSFWMAKLAQMGRKHISVFSRPLRYRNQTVRLPTGTHTTLVGQEKGIDVRIALDVVRLGWQKKYDVALIFSQDQDLSEVADEVRDISKHQMRWIRDCALHKCPQLVVGGIAYRLWNYFFRLAFFLGLVGLMSATFRIKSSNLEPCFSGDFGINVEPLCWKRSPLPCNAKDKTGKSNLFTLCLFGFKLICMNLSTAIRSGCNRRGTLNRQKQIGVNGLFINTLMGRWKPLPISIHVRQREKIEGVSSFSKEFGFVADIKRQKKCSALILAHSRGQISRHVRSTNKIRRVNLNILKTNAERVAFQGLHLWNNSNILFVIDKLNLIRNANTFQLRTICDFRNRQSSLILQNKHHCKRGFGVQSRAGRNCNFRAI
jgi:uncharacterized LabA/DUF88 family protein